MTSLINSCYASQICDLFCCRQVTANSVSVCWMALPLTVTLRCRQMVDLAPSLLDDFHPHFSSMMFHPGQPSAAEASGAKLATAFSLFHPENRKRSKSCFAELHRGGESVPSYRRCFQKRNNKNSGNSREICTTMWA